MKAVALDFETTKEPKHFPYVPGAILVLGSTYDSNEKSKIYLFNHKEVTVDQEQVMNDLTNELNSANIIIAHNIQFELIWLHHININLNKSFWCTMIAEYILSGQRIRNISLDELAARYNVGSKLDMSWENIELDTPDIPLTMLEPYCREDARLAYEIFKAQYKRAKEMKLLSLIQLHSKFAQWCAIASYNGMKLDIDFLEQYQVELEQQKDEIVKKVHQIVQYPINIDSPKQVKAALFGGTFKVDGKEKVTRVLKSGRIKEYERKCKVDVNLPGIFSTHDDDLNTDKVTIKHLHCKTKEQRELKKLLLDYSEIKNILKTFCKGLLNRHIDGIIHPQLNQTVTATGRLSSSNPNSHNIPRSGTARVKKAFISRFPKGVILEVDLSSLEWGRAADLSGDPVMLEEIRNGHDPHLYAAVHWFGSADHRADAKIFNFRYIYGGTPYGFYLDPRMPNFGLRKWECIVTELERKYTRLVEWHEELIREVYRNGFIRNPSGRILTFEPKVRFGVRDYHIPEIKNYPVQSWATADLAPLAFCLALREIYRALDATVIKLTNFVHDSMVFDCMTMDIAKEAAVIAAREIHNTHIVVKKLWNYDMKIPLDCEAKAGPSWGEMEKLEV